MGDHKHDTTGRDKTYTESLMLEEWGTCAGGGGKS